MADFDPLVAWHAAMHAHGLVPTRLSWDPFWGHGSAEVIIDGDTLKIRVHLEPGYRASGGEVDVFNGTAFYRDAYYQWPESSIQRLIADINAWVRAPFSQPP